MQKAKVTKISKEQIKRGLQKGRDIMVFLDLWDEETTKFADKLMKDKKFIDKIYRDHNETNNRSSN